MNDLEYLSEFSKKYDDSFLTVLHSSTINVIKACEAVADVDENVIVGRVMGWIADTFPEEEDIEKYAIAMVRTHKNIINTRNIHKEIACTKYDTKIPTEDQIESVKKIPGKYAVEDKATRSWDEYYYNVTVQVARNSKCLSRKIGAILVKDKTIISTGYNGPPRGIPRCDLRWAIDEDFINKYKPVWAESADDLVSGKCPRHTLGAKSGELTEICPAAHAEENAILSCAREGISTKGAIMYMTCSIPCFRCMIKIINAGISELVMTGTDVYDDNTMYLLSNSDVKVRLYDFI